MNGSGVDPEQEFFVTGATTYLDVDAAMTEFRRQVQDHCKKVVGNRLDAMNRASVMDWTLSDLKDYREADLAGIHLGKQLRVEGFGLIYFYLTLSRENNRQSYASSVCLYRQNGRLAVDLWARLDGSSKGTAWSTSNVIVFSRSMNKDELQNFSERLNQAVDDYIAFISASGGLKKYL